MTWTLHLGDCLDPVSGLASLPDKSVDHVITDPPYSEALYARTRTNKGTMREGNRIRPASDMAAKMELASRRIGAIDHILPEVSFHIQRIARRWIIVFSDVEIAPRWRETFGSDYVRTGVWVKPNPMPQISGDRPGQGFETATIAHRPGRKRWNGGGRAAVWTVATCQGIERPDHPSPKPLDLMRTLVADFTDAGETVVDPFAGSGTTGIACKELGRSFIGWERDEKFHAIATRRLNGDEAKPRPEQPSLFDAVTR